MLTRGSMRLHAPTTTHCGMATNPPTTQLEGIRLAGRGRDFSIKCAGPPKSEAVTCAIVDRVRKSVRREEMPSGPLVTEITLSVK